MNRTRKTRRSAEGLQIMAALRKGKEDVQAGRTNAHTEVEKLVEAWFSK